MYMAMVPQQARPHGKEGNGSPYGLSIEFVSMRPVVELSITV